MRKFSSYILAAGLSLLMLAVPALAQGPGGHGPGRDPGKMVERLKSELSLTDQQVAQLTPLFQEQQARHKARFEAMKAQLDSVLTPEQKARLEQLKAERKEKWANRKPGEGRGERKAHGSKGEMAKQFAEKLGLTADQQARLQQMREQGMQEMKAEREAFQARLAQVLTPDQKAKWDELKQRHHKGGRKPQQG